MAGKSALSGSTKRFANVESPSPFAQLAKQYEQLTGERPYTRSVAYLRKRVAWLVQAQELGGPDPAIRKRALEVARLSDVRLTPPATPRTEKLKRPRNTSLPRPGTILTRTHRGVEHQVAVLESGFEWNGMVYRSLSGVAKAITGSHCSGPAFFGLTGKSKNG